MRFLALDPTQLAFLIPLPGKATKCPHLFIQQIHTRYLFYAMWPRNDLGRSTAISELGSRRAVTQDQGPQMDEVRQPSRGHREGRSWYPKLTWASWQEIRKKEGRPWDFGLPAAGRAPGLYSFPSARPRCVHLSEAFQHLPHGRHRSPVSDGRRSSDDQKTKDDKYSQRAETDGNRSLAYKVRRGRGKQRAEIPSTYCWVPCPAAIGATGAIRALAAELRAPKPPSPSSGYPQVGGLGEDPLRASRPSQKPC